MKKFLDEDFLLENETAKYLYHEHAAKMPIIDYHCHIDPKEIAENHKFQNITEAWLGADHYKWRMIRSNGVEEKYIMGDALPREKFQKFAEALDKAIGNPLYHWTHLELQRYFDCQTPLDGESAEGIWQLCNEKLQQPEQSVLGLIKESNVEVICTTDDPVDDLRWHKKIKEDNRCTANVLPTMRPDGVLNIEKSEFAAYLCRLGEGVGTEIQSIDDIRQVLAQRIAFFAEVGCRISDHGLDYMFYREASEQDVNAILQKALRGDTLTVEEVEAYKTYLLVFLAGEYYKYDWGMQIHYSCQRNPNTRALEILGSNTGFDCIATGNGGYALTRFLDALSRQGKLPKTIIYSLNPNENALIGSIIGSFQGPEIAGKVQLGAAWWFNDTKTGMIDQLTAFANFSVLGNFIGMLTDSRSFLSYTRHEYFRRILCNLIGTWAENGEYPNDRKKLGKMVENISYYNALRYFGF
ncbi:glucuronate isomerase [Pelosinus fermentans]|uniref:Uronate isomerase n=1 Tax=Pelosinus fermentans JBW45 TaxID=1192197 RepID=I8U0I7_9FIRM|nr:glucuronate isomerase [Pelosinus fermentans]AJQ26355.1 Uronate isomerase [Pelosinus fermentans JBW45]